jgi:hypothetical protein
MMGPLSLLMAAARGSGTPHTTHSNEQEEFNSLSRHTPEIGLRLLAVPVAGFEVDSVGNKTPYNHR